MAEVDLTGYKRRTIADPEGTTAHFGDCAVYSLAAICDCGLLRRLIIVDIDEALKIYPKFADEWMRHERNLAKLEGDYFRSS